MRWKFSSGFTWVILAICGINFLPDIVRVILLPALCIPLTVLLHESFHAIAASILQLRVVEVEVNVASGVCRYEYSPTTTPLTHRAAVYLAPQVLTLWSFIATLLLPFPYCLISGIYTAIFLYMGAHDIRLVRAMWEGWKEGKEESGY